jgi:methyl acetate hydrolase
VCVAEPGARWEYGVSIDWAGKVVEAVRGAPLDAVMRTHIFEPLRMDDTGYLLTPSMRARRAGLHQRQADGSLVPLPLTEPPQSPKAQTGGSGLFSTAADYAKFIRMILRDGAAPDGRPVLEPQTVSLMTSNRLGTLKMRPLPGAMPALTNPVDLYPETSKSWGYSWMINDQTTNTGRPAGSVGWAGLPNLYYWIDRRNGIGGFWGLQILPFVDPASVGAFLEFETAVYAHLG